MSRRVGSNPTSSAILGSRQVGKAQDFDSCISLVRVQAAQPYAAVAQQVEHQTENLGRAGSIPACGTNCELVESIFISVTYICRI